MRKHFLTYGLLLGMTLPSLAQDFLKDYKAFYNLMKELPSYRMEGTVNIFNDDKLESTISIEIEKLEQSYFMKVGQNEVIYSKDMVITMNPDFRSIMVSERQEDKDFNIFEEEESFRRIAHLINSGELKYEYNDSPDAFYRIPMKDSTFREIHFYKSDGIFNRIVSYYRLKGVNYTHSELNLKLKKDAELDPQNFGITRYTIRKKGEYQLRESYSNYQISLN